MSHEQLESALKRLPQIGRLIERDRIRQVWRFEHDGKPLRVHFYPRSSAIGKIFRGNPALRELAKFQRLQKAGVQSPRAISVMIGFKLDQEIGDALLLESIDGDIPLEQFPRITFRRQLIEILHQLARSGLGHNRLSLDCFRIQNEKLYLTDARDISRNGLRLRHLYRLANSASPFATRSDYLKVWRAVGPDRPLPTRNPISNRIWRQFIRTVTREGEHFQRIKLNDWTGVFTRRAPHTMRWASATQQTFSLDDWKSAWPALLEQIQSDQLPAIKRDRSGEVLSTDITLNGQTFSIIIKRPRRKFWWRYLTELGRGSRARRTWIKTWKMLIRDVPCEWPMLLMERRILGYPLESLVIFQRVAGETLAKIDLDKLRADDRENLFRRTGKILRKIEDLGFTHTDAKSTNWIAFNDETEGARPILVDVDGVRHYRWSMMGIDRLLRAMKQHPQYTPADSLALCKGFAPRAKFARDVSSGVVA